MSPLIVIPGRRSENDSGVRGPACAVGARYVTGVTVAGGTAMVLPPMSERIDEVAEIVERFDGVLLHGGIDVSPWRYHQAQIHSSVTMLDESLDNFELAVLDAALRQNKPILAICRGMQLLNVALGGTLFQHLPDHRPSDVNHWASSHTLSVEKTSLLYGAVRDDVVEVASSYHHQGVDRLGSNLKPTGFAPDGLVEAIEHMNRDWVIGVQWHPEDTLDATSTKLLMSEFVMQCRRRRNAHLK